MQTIYYSTRNFIHQQDKIVDLDAYRRRCYEVEEEEEEILSEAPEVLPSQTPVLSKADRRGWLLDLWASLGILVMTATFTIRILAL